MSLSRRPTAAAAAAFLAPVLALLSMVAATLELVAARAAALFGLQRTTLLPPSEAATVVAPPAVPSQRPAVLSLPPPPPNQPTRPSPPAIVAPVAVRAASSLPSSPRPSTATTTLVLPEDGAASTTSAELLLAVSSYFFPTTTRQILAAAAEAAASSSSRRSSAVPTRPSSPTDPHAAAGLGALPSTAHLGDGVGASGREKQPLTPQTVGRYFAQPVGEWSGSRAALPATLLHNLDRLGTASKDREQQVQLHLEAMLHWHCLGLMEKATVLDALVRQMGAVLAPGGAVADWVFHAVLATPAADAAVLLDACAAPTQQRLGKFFAHAGDQAMLKQLYGHLRNTNPLDHLYDYGGFLEATGRVYGSLPPATAQQHSVCVVGAGPAGIVAADGLNRLGVKVTVLEQAAAIGGRLKTVRLPPHGDDDADPDGDGQEGRPEHRPPLKRPLSPTPLEMGGMRFAPFAGNSFYRLIELYGLPTRPFPNPSTVATSYLIGNEVYEAEPGEAPTHPVLAKVRADYTKAMGALLDPILAARAAADAVALRTLCDAAIRRFDKHTFQSGMNELLSDQGIQWSMREWDVFGAIGIGVGGYEGYYTTGFLEEFRFLADQRLEDHVFLPGGANSVLVAIVNDTPACGTRTSLADLGAVRLETEVVRIVRHHAAPHHQDGSSSSGGFSYEVTMHDKRRGTTTTETFSEVVFAAGPSEAIRLGLTGLQPGSEPIMPDDLAMAMRRANLVGATKLAVKVPLAAFASLDLPNNIQSSQPFQQVYVLPPVDGATSRTIFLSYQLGDNATKTAAMDGHQQFALFVSIIRNAALREPGNPAYAKLGHFADVLERGKERLEFEAWSQEKHFGGAFKMDRPLQVSNTRRLWASTLSTRSKDGATRATGEKTEESENASPGAIFVNEMLTAEGGFASGAVSAAINGVQQFIVRNGGTLPPNSPLDQVALYE